MRVLLNVYVHMYTRSLSSHFNVPLQLPPTVACLGEHPSSASRSPRNSQNLYIVHSPCSILHILRHSRLTITHIKPNDGKRFSSFPRICGIKQTRLAVCCCPSVLRTPIRQRIWRRKIKKTTDNDDDVNKVASRRPVFSPFILRMRAFQLQKRSTCTASPDSRPQHDFEFEDYNRRSQKGSPPPLHLHLHLNFQEVEVEVPTSVVVWCIICIHIQHLVSVWLFGTKEEIYKFHSWIYFELGLLLICA